MNNLAVHIMDKVSRKVIRSIHPQERAAQHQGELVEFIGQYLLLLNTFILKAG